MKSIRAKILILVIGCVLLTASVIGSTVIFTSHKIIQLDSVEMMNLLCENKTTELNSILQRIKQSVETLTIYATNQLTDVEQFMTDPSYVDNYSEEMRKIAVNAAQNTDGALTVYIRFDPKFTDSQSGIFCSRNSTGESFQDLIPTNLTMYDAENISRIGWFTIPAKNGTATWMPPYYNENINVHMISYVVPFYIDDIFIGVVGMDIDFRLIEDLVNDMTLYDSGYAFLASSNAQVIHHPDFPIFTELTTINQGELQPVVDELKKETSRSSLFSYRYNNSSKKIAFRTLLNNMHLVVTAPTSEISRISRNLTLQIALASIFIVCVSIFLASFLARKLVRPLKELNLAAQKIAQGDFSICLTPTSQDEVGTLTASFQETVKHLQHYIKYINRLAYRDSLTGANNKTAYLDVVTKMDELTLLKRPEFAVVVFDINGLKLINDNCGHDWGDVLISDSCKILSKVFAKSPIYRIGGDEFVAILENGDFANYHTLLTRLQEETDSYNQQTTNPFQISIAKGVAIYNSETDMTFNDVFKRADSNMYRNKDEMKKGLSISEQKC